MMWIEKFQLNNECVYHATVPFTPEHTHMAFVFSLGIMFNLDIYHGRWHLGKRMLKFVYPYPSLN